jgi:poly(A) polymerase
LTTSDLRDSIISKSIIIPAAKHGLAVKQLCPNATRVVTRLQDAGYEAYIVGGSVRDLLLGKIPKDFDVATDATPEQVQDVFPRARLIGRRFRIAHVRMSGSLIEVATFRGHHSHGKGDSEHANGRILRDNVFGSLEEDARRRDFTINALFMDPVSGDIRDFVGGYEDLENRLLRLIGDPQVRYREDPVRLLRAARFVAKLGVEPVPETADPIAELAPLLADMPPARLFDEVNKLFLTGHGMRTLEALQRFHLTCSLFPVLCKKPGSGKTVIGPVLHQALLNTDARIREKKSVTPGFLFAALLWQPLQERSLELQQQGEAEYHALQTASEEIIKKQVGTTAIPRRFSAVTRQIWVMQARFRKTRGKRASRLLHDRRFRAGYDFLLLRVYEDPSLEKLAEFWTHAQIGMEPRPQHDEPRRRPRRRPRRGRSSATS